MSDLVNTCKKLLEGDVEKFKNPNFKHAEYIVGILQAGPNNDFTGKYNELEEREKEVDEIVSRIVHERFDEFNSLIEKPEFFGKKYDTAKQLITTSRKKIKRAKELLEKKNKNITQSLHKSMYNKELLNVLEKVEVCNTLFVKIDTLIKNKAFYELSENILKLRSLTEGFKDFEGTLVIKSLKENEKSKTQEVCNLINKFIRNYFYYYEQNFDWDALGAVDSNFKFDKLDLKSFIPGENRRTSLSRNFLTEQKNYVQASLSFVDSLLKLYNLDLEKFFLFEQKLQQIKTILTCPPKNVELKYDKSSLMLADPEVFESIHIIKYICFSLEISQFEKYSSLIKKADAMQKELISQSDKSDIMNLFLSIKSADTIGIFHLIFIDYFANLRANVRATNVLIQTFFLDSLEAEKLQEEAPVDEAQEDFSKLLFGSLPQFDSKSAFNNISKTSDTLDLCLAGDLFTIWNFNEKTCKSIIDFFKQIVMMIVVLLRKNGLLQILISHFKKNVDKIPLINFRETWKIILSEFEETFDRIFKMRTEVDFSGLKTNEFFEASFLPSKIKGKLQKSKTMRDSVDKKASDSSKSLDDFLSGKLISSLDLNFLYTPLVLNVVYRPLLFVTTQIEGLCTKSAMKDLVKESKNIGNLAYDQINNFFDENIEKFVLLYKIEYIKLIFDNFAENRLVAVKNPPKEKKSPEVKRAAIPPSFKKTEEMKFSVDGQQKPEEPSNPEEIKPQPSLKAEAALLNLNIEEMKEKYSSLNSFFPEVVSLTANMLNLSKLTLYLPVEKTSGMLDLLNWSMNACYQEVSYKFKNEVQGSLALAIVESYKENEHFKSSTGLNKMKEYLSQQFPIVVFKPEMKADKATFKKACKKSYKNYISGTVFIADGDVMSNDKQINLIVNILENLEVFLQFSYSIFWNIVSSLPLEDLKNLSITKINANSKIQISEFNFTQQSEKVLEVVEKLKAKLQNEGIDVFLARFSSENLNLKEPSRYNRHLTHDKPDVGFLKFLSIFKDMIDLMMKSFSVLIAELHIRSISYLIRQAKSTTIASENKIHEVSSQNFKSLFRETYLYYEALKNGFMNNKADYIFEDYYPLITKIIKISFMRSEKTNGPFVKNYLHNVLSLEKNLVKFESDTAVIEEKEACIAKLKRYLNLFLVEEEELKSYLQYNKIKIKRKDVESYIDLKMKELKTESKINEKKKFFTEILSIFKEADKK